jgi:hypothetical protein
MIWRDRRADPWHDDGMTHKLQKNRPRHAMRAVARTVVNCGNIIRTANDRIAGSSSRKEPLW